MSLFKNMKLKGPAILLNWTGYIEESATAATWLRF